MKGRDTGCQVHGNVLSGGQPAIRGGNFAAYIYAMKSLLFASLLAVIVGLYAFTVPDPVNGAWRITEVQTVRKDGTVTSVRPVESLVLFADGYYSFCWSSERNPLRSWQQTDSARLARAGQMIVNAGTYRVEGSQLITSASVALSPMFTGGAAGFQYTRSGDTLVLRGTGVISAEGIQHPVYAGGGYIITRMVKL
jgi:hypothetical protein